MGTGGPDRRKHEQTGGCSSCGPSGEETQLGQPHSVAFLSQCSSVVIAESLSLQWQAFHRGLAQDSGGRRAGQNIALPAQSGQRRSTEAMEG